MRAERRPVANEPLVAVRVDAAALPVWAPRRFVVSDDMDTAIRAGGHGAGDERVWVVDEHLGARGPVAKHCRVSQPLPSGCPRKTGAFDVEPDHASKVSQLAGAKRVVGVRDRQHHKMLSSVATSARW
jgi:hypothetical protein